jgi:hypothetical protein
METADAAFKSIVSGYAAMNSHNAALVRAVLAAVAGSRSAK